MAKQILLFLFVLVVEFSLAKSYADESPHPGSTRPPPFNLTKLPGVKSIYPEFTGLPPFSRGLPGSRNFSSNRIGGRKSDVYPNWTPLICDGSDKGESGRLKSPAARDINGPVVMLIHNEYFYFYYEQFVISMMPPEFTKSFSSSLTDQTNRDVQLLTTRPVYVRHKSKKDSDKLNYLTTDSGFKWVRERFVGSVESLESAGKRTYVIVEEPAGPGKARKPQVYRVEYSSDYYGYLTKSDWKANQQKRQSGDKSFVRWDYVKWFELVYNQGFKSMDFHYWHPGRRIWLGDPAQRTQTYRIDSMVYWDQHIVPKKDYGDDHWHFNLWWATLIELDYNKVLHFHTYVFKISENSGELAIVAHENYDMPLVDLLDCRKKDNDYPLKSGNQLKGLILQSTGDGKTHTLLFIDQFYYVFNDDLMRVNFKLKRNEMPRQIFKFEFEDDITAMPVDLVGTKYVKHVVYGGSKAPMRDVRFAFDNYQTFRAIGNDASKPIRLKKSGESIAKCPHSTLSFVLLSSVTFCFDKREYYLFSSDNSLKEVRSKPSHRIPIANLFTGSNVNYGSEDIEYIFDIIEPKSQNDTTVVFMTYSWLLIFNKYEVFQVQDNGLDTEIKIRQQALFAPFYERKPNCLFNGCEK